MDNPVYLGDGVYAHFDGYQIVLRADNHIIYLEPSVMEELKKYWTKVIAEFGTNTESED